MLKKQIHFYIFFFCCLGFSISVFSQKEVPPKPSKETSVYDAADLLSPSEEQQLERKLLNYADTTSTQIVVATITSLEGEYIGLYAPKWAHEWGIGQAKEDNGLLILLSQNDRKIWITTGYGLEEYLTDATTKDIIENIILPEFKNNNYYQGLDKGTTAIFQVLEGTFEGTPPRGGGGGFPGELLILALFFIIFFISLGRKRNNRGGPGSSRQAGASLLDVIILSSLGRGGFGGGSSGGGSFGSGGFGGGFGGGGFGGGGAGGSW